MKKHLIYVLLVLSVLSCIEKRGSDQKDILKVLEDQRQAWNKGDIEAYMQGYDQSDSLVFIGRNGPEYGWKTTLENYKKFYPDKPAMGFLTFEIKKVDLLGSGDAFVIGNWHLKREKDEPHGSFTLLLKKVQGKWKIVVDHSS